MGIVERMFFFVKGKFRYTPHLLKTFWVFALIPQGERGVTVVDLILQGGGEIGESGGLACLLCKSRLQFWQEKHPGCWNAVSRSLNPCYHTYDRGYDNHLSTMMLSDKKIMG